MLNVSKDTIKEFIDSFIDKAVFSDLSLIQLADLKNYLVKYLEGLYDDNTKNIINVIDQLNNVNPFIIKLALEYGIMEEDAVDIVEILFMKINEYFYKKGSFDNIKSINKVLKYYGIDCFIKKVLYRKEDDKYLLEDVYTGEVIYDKKIKEILVPGHMVTREEYKTYTFESNYQTIVIYIKMNMFSTIGFGMQNPAALLQAYSITKHRQDSISIPINKNMYTLTFEDSLYMLQYYYFRYIKFKDPNFKLNETPTTMWNLFISKETELSSAEILLSEYLSGGYDNREGAAYFVRTSRFILNKHKINTKAVTLEDISKKAHTINDKMAKAIESITTEQLFIQNTIDLIHPLEVYVKSLPTSTLLEQAVQSTVNYLLLYVVFLIRADFSKEARRLILKYKKYFLPIYTQFYFDEDNSFIIKNKHQRIFTETQRKVTVDCSTYSKDKAKDKITATTVITQADINETLDSMWTDISDSYNITIGPL